MQTDTIHPMLIAAKRIGIKLIASDIDWTLRDPTDQTYNFQAVQKLCLKVLQKNITILLLTGRDASLQRNFFPNMISLLKRYHIVNSMYAGCANGIKLYKICNKGFQTIYKNHLSEKHIDEILKIIRTLQSSYKLTSSDFQQRGISVFQSFLKSDWKSIIPKKYIQKAKLFNGTVFAEHSKLSFVLPKSQTITELFISKMKKELPNIYCVQNDLEFGHVSLAKSSTGQMIADKSLALEFVKKILHISNNQLIVFGGALDQIDKKMLNNYPFSFTNQQKYTSAGNKKRTYKLIGKQSPVGLVYEAIKYIIS